MLVPCRLLSVPQRRLHVIAPTGRKDLAAAFQAAGVLGARPHAGQIQAPGWSNFSHGYRSRTPRTAEHPAQGVDHGALLQTSRPGAHLTTPATWDRDRSPCQM